MSAILHHFRHYYLRLRWELLAWWLLSGAASVLALRDASMGQMQHIARAEIAALLWMVIRLALIDDAFGTLAGRSSRPVATGQILPARLLLIAITILPPLLLRVGIWQYSIQPDGAAWADYLKRFGPQMAMAAMLGVLFQATTWLLRRKFHGGGRKLQGAFAIAAGLTALYFAESKVKPEAFHYWQTGGHYDDSALLPGVMATLPKEALLLGQWWSNGRDPRYITTMKESGRVPAMEGRFLLEPGVEAILERPAITEGRVKIRMNLRCRDPLRAEALRKAVPVLRYRDGHYGEFMQKRAATEMCPLSLFLVHVTEVTGEVATPEILPWRREPRDKMLAGAEVLIFEQNSAVPNPDPEPGLVPEGRAGIIYVRKGEEVALPRIHRKVVDMSNRQGSFIGYAVVPEGPEVTLEEQVQACLRMGRTDDPRVKELLMSKNGAVVPIILRSPTWDDSTWKELVRPVLLAKATDEYRSLLLERAKLDGRVLEILREKGWEQDAVVFLKERLRSGFPVGPRGVALLARTGDGSLASELKEMALRWPEAQEEMEKALMAMPGFDWRGFSLEGWERWKFQQEKKWWFGLLAARQGNEEALRYLKEEAGRNPNPWYGERWKELGN